MDSRSCEECGAAVWLTVSVNELAHSPIPNNRQIERYVKTTRWQCDRFEDHHGVWHEPIDEDPREVKEHRNVFDDAEENP